MSESILENTKKVLSIDPSYNAFDVDIMMHINTVFNTLHQLGVGRSMVFRSFRTKPSGKISPETRFCSTR